MDMTSWTKSINIDNNHTFGLFFFFFFYHSVRNLLYLISNLPGSIRFQFRTFLAPQTCSQ